MKLDTTHAKNNHILNIPQPTIIASDDAHNWIPGLWSNFWDHHWIKWPLFTHTSPSSPHPIWLCNSTSTSCHISIYSPYTQTYFTYILLIYGAYLTSLVNKNTQQPHTTTFPVFFPWFSQVFWSSGGEWLDGPSAWRTSATRLRPLDLAIFFMEKSWWRHGRNRWRNNLVGGFNPSEKYESQWEGLSHILWKIKNVSNYQPVMNKFDGDMGYHGILLWKNNG